MHSAASAICPCSSLIFASFLIKRALSISTYICPWQKLLAIRRCYTWTSWKSSNNRKDRKFLSRWSSTFPAETVLSVSISSMRASTVGVSAMYCMACCTIAVTAWTSPHTQHFNAMLLCSGIKHSYNTMNCTKLIPIILTYTVHLDRESSVKPQNAEFGCRMKGLHIRGLKHGLLYNLQNMEQKNELIQFENHYVHHRVLLSNVSTSTQDLELANRWTDLFQLRTTLWEEENLFIKCLPRLRFIAQLNNGKDHFPCTRDISCKAHLLLIIQQRFNGHIQLTVLCITPPQSSARVRCLCFSMLDSDTPNPTAWSILIRSSLLSTCTAMTERNSTSSTHQHQHYNLIGEVIIPNPNLRPTPYSKHELSKIAHRENIFLQRWWGRR